MGRLEFREKLLGCVDEFKRIISTPGGDWSVKGFIDVAKNIGSCITIEELQNGTGPFSKYGIKVFDDFWMNYLTQEMAKNADLKKPPYRNLKEYLRYRNLVKKK